MESPREEWMSRRPRLPTRGRDVKECTSEDGCFFSFGGDPPCSPLPRGESLFDPADAAAEPKGVCGGNAPGLSPHRQPTAHPPSTADAVLREGVEQVAEVVEG